MQNHPRISIVGASGYSGAELLRLLQRHPRVRLEKLFANTSAGKRVADVYPVFEKAVESTFEPYSVGAACSSDLVFVALPSGEAMHIVPELLEKGKKVVDLGGDFRLTDGTLYEQYYKHKHAAPAFLGRAAYGLPEWNRKTIRQSSFVSNPGCYPTGALLPLLPLLKEGLIEREGIVISSLSGVSGAGRSSSVELSFVEVNENVRAYKVGIHQHIPEIRTAIEAFTGNGAQFTFVPHLIPITRGIYTSLYALLKRHATDKEIFDLFHSYYEAEPFIRISATGIPEIKNVAYTNSADIGFRIHPESDRLTVFSTIDNLVKGAAGQAIQNMNILFGYQETEGLV